MPHIHGRVITDDQNIGDGVVVSRNIGANQLVSGKIASGAIVAGEFAAYAVGSGNLQSGAVGANMLRMYATNASCPDMSSLTISHNLGATPSIIIATTLSHVSNVTIIGQVDWRVGLVNNSQLVLQPIMSSGFIPVSGLPLHVAVIAP